MKSVLVLALLGGAVAAQAVFFQPDSATALSEFSGSYDIGNAIDGSGLPGGFGPTDSHANYTQNNHWTTATNAILNGTAKATFNFNSDVTIGTFYMWNHRSNGVASNGNYGVRRFDLVLKDQGGNTLYSMLNQSANWSAGTAQFAEVFGFAPVSGVRSVEFNILENGWPVGTSNSQNYTGVAEVGFDTESVPEPATMAILAVVGLAAARRRRK